MILVRRLVTAACGSRRRRYYEFTNSNNNNNNIVFANCDRLAFHAAHVGRGIAYRSRVITSLMVNRYATVARNNRTVPKRLQRFRRGGVLRRRRLCIRG